MVEGTLVVEGMSREDAASPVTVALIALSFPTHGGRRLDRGGTAHPRAARRLRMPWGRRFRS